MDRIEQREIRRALGRGDVLVAYDLALQALDAAPDDLELKYLSVLALVRSGAPSVADARYRRLELDGAAADGQLGIDIGALAGRIAKDRALSASDPAERQELLARAIEAYQRVVDKTGDVYPAVNVAALSLWAGDVARSRQAAETVLCRLADVPQPNRDYWHFATSAEAHLLTGDVAAAGAAIVVAASHGDTERQRDWHGLAVTADQMRRSCRAHGLDEAILEPLRAPPIVVYAGDRGDPEDEMRLTGTIDAKLADNRAVVAFGGLRAGFEIAFAEAAIARNAELNVILPFPIDFFVEREVKPFGASWTSRFEACLSAAASVRFATDHGFSGQAAAVRYARRLAMGHGILRARRLDTSSMLIVGTAGGAGDCEDAARTWTETGRDASVMPYAGASIASEDARLTARPSGDFIEVASLFGDFMGFGRLPEDRVADYADYVLGGIADVLDRYGDDVKARNSWGDAIVAQFYDVRLAARCAIDLQTFLRDLHETKAARGIDLQMRIGLHYGPVQKVRDRVQGRDSYLGTHVVRAARIEPVAIPGMIYVSEPFAAALAVDSRDDLVCDYLGRLDAAKGFGRMPLYALREAPTT